MADTKAHQRYRSKVQMQKNGLGKIFPGVTTIIGANLGWNGFILLKWTREKALSGEDPDAIRDDSADSGTCCHKMVEYYIRRALGEDVGDPDLSDFDANQIKSAENGFRAFLKWEPTQDFRYVASEMEVVSEEWLFGGTADIITVDAKGRIHLIDIKTSGGIYDEMKIQTAAYSKAYEEQEGVQVYQNHIVRLDKEDEEGSYEHHVISRKEIDWGWSVFVLLRELHEKHKRKELK